MIITKQRNDVTIQGDVTHSSKMHINTEGQGHLIRLLTKTYSDVIGSIIREQTANAKDSMTMAGNNNPVIVKIVKESNGEYSFQVYDEGLGLDDIEFNKYIMGIGESTKQLISNVLGGYGVGCKAPSAYQDTYFYTCRKNGIERKFMIYSGEEVPESLLLHEKETEESNGVIVTIPIKQGDLSDFEYKIKEQLCYFTGVYFENCDVDNNFKVYRNDLFQYSELCQDDNIHISLDDVYYPIDFNKLGISPIKFPVAIRFHLEEGLITPIPNRENIEYTKQTKQAIADKIKLIADWFITKFNETLTETEDVDVIYSYFAQSDKYYEFGGNNFNISRLKQFSGIQIDVPTFKSISKLNLRSLYENYDNFLNLYTVKSKIVNGKFTGKYISGEVTNGLHNNRKMFLIDTQPNKKMIEYIKDTYGDCWFIHKTHKYELGKISHNWGHRDISFIKMLKLKEYSKSDWRQVINEYLSVVKTFENKLVHINSIQISKEWEESRKKARKISQSTRNQKLEGEINFKIAEQVERSCNWNCKFVSNVINLKDFHKRKELIVYGLEEQRQKLDDLFEIYKRSPKNKVEAAIVGQRDYEKLKKVKLHNLMTIEEFESSFNKPIARYVTAYKIEEFWSSNTTLFKNRSFIEGHINKEFGICIDRLKDYKDAYKNPSNELMKSLITFADKHKYYDYPMYELLENVKKEAPKLEFLKFFETNSRYSYSNTINKEALPIIQELLKARKFRMDWKHYLPKEETILETELVEQDVEN